MKMQRNLRAGLEPNDLHFQAIGYGHILDKESMGERRWFPRQIAAIDA